MRHQSLPWGGSGRLEEVTANRKVRGKAKAARRRKRKAQKAARKKNRGRRK